MIDTHCHLDLVKGIQRLAGDEDLTGIKTITVTNSPMFYLPNLNLFKTAKNIRVALGLHPELAVQQKVHLPLITELLADSRFIGEIGLDGSQDFKEQYPQQLSNFKAILGEIGKYGDKILTVHSRNAAKETVELLHQYLSKTNCKIIMHWYTGNIDVLMQAIGYGYYFSVNHKMLRSKRAILLIKEIPLRNILTETDSPFTFDEQVDSRRKSLEITVSGLATIYGINELEIKKKIYSNFKDLLS
ncbi:Qat anti-phage system TatD family nuclease QatD [Pedobacter jeongneungensis]|uniref:Qat anti-phage system TatD family nuclease QatD n=1 Tax=Pedobacter jeongneungensis TaxID=947309 RepID=UPI0013B3C30C|nr:Qat anti-phage system TatD family nuclease QatD [Pedobacter jeongneungensis]